MSGADEGDKAAGVDDALLRELEAMFLDELDGYVGALNRDLVALEKSRAPQARAELGKSLLRTAHSLKGASRAVGKELIARVCHRVEGMLAQVAGHGAALDDASMTLLYEIADALAEARWSLPQPGAAIEAKLGAVLERIEREAPTPSSEAEASPPEEPSSQAVSSQPASAEVTGAVRVAGARVDALRAAAAGLFVARQSTHERDADIGRLQDAVRHLRTALAARGAVGAERAESEAERRERDASLFARAEQGLRRIEADIDKLASRVVADRRTLSLAAAPLEDEIERLSLRPFADACVPLARAARDVAVPAGKRARLTIDGGEVGFDRARLDALRDPLLQLVRNAVAHGIEPPDERRARGKPPEGTITISAALVGGSVAITVADDGRGIDIGKLRELAAARGMASPASDEEAIELIFVPGLSTAPRVTDLSGRGVGLDVVRTRVRAMGGRVEVTTAAGEGTRLSLLLPLTLSRVKSIVTLVGGECFVIPAASVATLVFVTAAARASIEGRPVLRHGSSPLPLVSLAALLGLPERAPALSENGHKTRVPAVILEAMGQRVALTVEELSDEQDLVVRSLGPRLIGLRHLAGATLLPSGRLALFLNPTELVRRVLAQSSRRRAARVEAAEAAPPARVARRVLLADDSLTTRTLIKSILETAGYRVHVASDGAQALALLESRGADIVVSDVEMPNMDGFELTRRVRGSPRHRELPIVLLTGRASDEDKARGAAAGANAYLVKSAFDQRNLLDTLRQLL